MAHGDALQHCPRCNALYNTRERSDCPGCVLHAERALSILHSLINQFRAAGVELRVDADRMADLTDIGLVWTASWGNHHVRRPI